MVESLRRFSLDDWESISTQAMKDLALMLKILLSWIVVIVLMDL